MADKKDGGESAGGTGALVNNRTRLDYGRHRPARRGGRIGRFSHGGRIERGDR